MHRHACCQHRLLLRVVKLSRAAPLALAFLLAGCPVPVVMDVANKDVEGHVVEKATGLPVANALVVQTIGRGGFWTTPSTYDLGHSFSAADGAFRIPAAPQRLLNVSDSNERPSLGIFAPGYNPTWFFLYPSEPSHINIRLEKLDSHATGHDLCLPVPYTWPTCKLIREHLHP
jgi:hypothetical protein